MPLVTIWMDTENVMLSEFSQTKTNIVWFQVSVESKIQNKWRNITEFWVKLKKKESDWKSINVTILTNILGTLSFLIRVKKK